MINEKLIPYNKLDKNIKIIFKKMAEMVNCPVEHINSNDTWYNDYSWTKEQELEFKNWMVKYLKEHSRIERELFGFMINDKLRRDRVYYFIFNYGWKLKEK